MKNIKDKRIYTQNNLITRSSFDVEDTKYVDDVFDSYADVVIRYLYDKFKCSNSMYGESKRLSDVKMVEDFTDKLTCETCSRKVMTESEDDMMMRLKILTRMDQIR